MTHQIVPRFKKISPMNICPLNIQYTERSNYLPHLQYKCVYIRSEKF